jgi:hypothetical protein
MAAPLKTADDRGRTLALETSRFVAPDRREAALDTRSNRTVASASRASSG